MRRIFVALCLILLSAWDVRSEVVDEGQTEILPRGEAKVSIKNIQPESKPEPEPEPVDPYEGWENWCEDIDKQECRCSGEVDTCSGELVKDKGGVLVFEPCKPDRTGRPTVCLKKRGECVPRWLNRKKQRVQVENLRMIIDYVCEPPVWWEPDVQCWKFHWRTARKCKRKRWCDPEKLHRFFRVIAFRESTFDWQTIHALDPDREANRQSWYRHKKLGTYEGNVHFAQQVRWTFGMGWLGQNSANFVAMWDTMAPPEVLCRRVPAIESSLRKLRVAWRKIDSGIDCKDAEGIPYTRARLREGQKRDYKIDTKQTPTWYLLHRAVWGGDLCPQQTERSDFYQRAFERRVESLDLDPHEEVTLEMLGDPIPKKRQNEIATVLSERMKPIEWKM